jgi:hypothetical protein
MALRLFLPVWFALCLGARLFAAGDAIPTSAPLPERAPDEALCGPDIVTVGDAWEHVVFEQQQLHQLVERQGELVRWPQRAAALLSHLHFIQRRSLMVWDDDKDRLDHTLETLFAAAPAWNGPALADDRATLRTALATLDGWLKTVAGVFPDEALIPTTALTHLLPPPNPTLYIATVGSPLLIPGQPAEIRFRLATVTGIPVTPEQLLVTHTQPLHAMLIDDSLTEYYHEHPRPTAEPGVYAFRFTPRTARGFRLWIDVLPKASGRVEFPYCDIGQLPAFSNRRPDRTLSDLCETDGLRFKLTFDTPPRAGSIVAARLFITSSGGQPCQNLEPLMGAFAHFVAFTEDFASILHIHPHGVAPQPAERGGPGIEFSFRADRPGFLRMFVQVQTAGVVHLASFGATVLPADSR